MSLMIPMVIFMQQRLAERANKSDAAAMQAYMKIAQPFYGVKSPERKEVFKLARAHTEVNNVENYRRLVLWLWSGVYREEQYLAMDVAEYYKKFRTIEVFGVYEEMLKTADNWDTVDKIASNLVGKLVQEHRELEAKLIEWRTSDNMWLRRASLLAHLKHKGDTNFALLSETILMLAHEKEFFIQKAIGWVLREYSKTEPELVSAFTKQHSQLLAPLSQREAMRIMIKTSC
ncbi:DNA alkylation repair protein [Photobacterium jeanii]|uniref:DNA alkylation repair protein n=1 Tax=Photobacterium jeanii TaxID=858640 RepID=A0A178K382_9GAMM|nr:DNA alkylation repair protein [Photobacterium jeanii]OAN11183.1 DNA alkylation repair protein [Photobacterium jeanii]PST90702.1 DNA alkylation repair protein [Photobacterium jeanii]